MITLPLTVEWSFDGEAPAHDLSERVQLIRVYELVLTYGAAADVERYIDPEVLVDLWGDLTPTAAVRETWEPWVLRRLADAATRRASA